MRALLAPLTSILSLSAFSAFAECSDTVYGKIASGYVLKDVAVLGSSRPVEQGGFTRTCNKVSVGAWQSIGPEGGTANEIDTSLFYDDQAGPVKYQLAVEYYFVNLKGLDRPADDIVELYADVSVPVTRGRVTIAPMVRTIQMIGVKDLPSLTLIQPGARIRYTATEKLTLSVDVRDSINLTEHTSAWRWTIGGAYRLTPQLTGEVEAYGTSRTRSVFSLGFRYRY
jgi:hypothetical protein